MISNLLLEGAPPQKKKFSPVPGKIKILVGLIKIFLNKMSAELII